MTVGFEADEGRGQKRESTIRAKKTAPTTASATRSGQENWNSESDGETETWSLDEEAKGDSLVYDEAKARNCTHYEGKYDEKLGPK